MRKLSIRMFAHSLRSDWNNGNAHFLRGLCRALISLGHELQCYEPETGWSYDNLLSEPGGVASLRQFSTCYPELDIRLYREDEDLIDQLAEDLRGADIVIVHEWNTPQLAAAILSLRDRLGFRTLFLDTHHRASSSRAEIERLHLHQFDGILAFGEALRRIYVEQFGIPQTWTFHEAADTTLFRPLSRPKKLDCVWIGNWGDDERTRELQEFLICPARALRPLRFDLYGVRYPEQARSALASSEIAYRGYLPNLCVPTIFAEAMLTLHIPRRQYAQALPGIPTIRVFEALACGTPLICSPWSDCEELFDANSFWMAKDKKQMTSMMAELLRDSSAREQLAQSGLECILRRHTCLHRAEQLTAICEEVLL
jgi:spore maturation protein CgeB